MAKGSNNDTSTKGDNRSRGQETETVWHSRNRREWGHWIVVSYLGRRAYQQKAQHQARWQLQKYLKSLPFPTVPLFHKIFAFLHQKCTKKTKTDFQLCLYTGLVFSGLKGHSFVQSLVCWNHSQWCNSNKNTNTEQWQGERTRGDKNKTSYQIKRSQLIQKISKKTKVQLWHLWKERIKTARATLSLIFQVSWT